MDSLVLRRTLSRVGSGGGRISRSRAAREAGGPVSGGYGDDRRRRGLHSHAAAAARRELAEDIHPQLLEARAKYTDYVEPVAEEVVATGDDGWD